MGLVLQGVLNAPYPDDPAEMDIVTWVQARSAMREAAREIERLRKPLLEMQGHTFFCQDAEGALRRWYPPAES
jgi:hypothetical protein